METGDVFLWRNYPYAVTGKIKDRWFLYLGKYRVDPFSEIYLLIPTATTQLHHFEPGGRRASHSYIMIKASDGFGFEADCVIDFDEVFYDTTERDFAQFCSRGDIIPKGRIDNQQTLLKIYKAVEAARDVDRCIKLCVRYNLKEIGVNI